MNEVPHAFNKNLIDLGQERQMLIEIHRALEEIEQSIQEGRDLISDSDSNTDDNNSTLAVLGKLEGIRDELTKQVFRISSIAVLLIKKRIRTRKWHPLKPLTKITVVYTIAL